MIDLGSMADFGIAPSLQHSITELAEKNEFGILKNYSRCQKNYGNMRLLDDKMRLAVTLMLAKDAYRRYREMGIPDNVFRDTMSDIGIWCSNNGNRGLHNTSWLKNHISLELFRIGRLQFQFYRVPKTGEFINKLPFGSSTAVLNVHIPQGEKLDIEQCRSSFIRAITFFDTYFPEFKFDYFFCESWLLYNNNRDFMSSDSNIVRFMNMFDIVYSAPVDAQAIERIFGKRRLSSRLYPENTSLQRNAKKYIASGGRLGFGIGIIPKNKFIK